MVIDLGFYLIYYSPLTVPVELGNNLAGLEELPSRANQDEQHPNAHILHAAPSVPQLVIHTHIFFKKWISGQIST